MIDDDFLDSLPNDPIEAFVAFEEHLRKAIMAPIMPFEDRNELLAQYAEHIIAFAGVYDIDLGEDFKYEPSEEDLSEYVARVKYAAGLKAKRLKLEYLGKGKPVCFGVYALKPNEKIKIHHHINRIRDILSNANLTPQLRDALSDRLNEFTKQVDKDRTRLDALTSMYLFAKREAKNELKPLLDSINNIYELLEKAGELVRLPQRDRNKELPPPPMKIEGPKD